MNKILKQEDGFRLVKGKTKYWVEKKFLFWWYKLHFKYSNKELAEEYFEMAKQYY